MFTPDDIIRKIQALLQKTVDNDASKEEAEAAALMVQKLLLKYNLDMADVQSKAKGKKKKEFNNQHYNLDGVQGRHDSDWVECLINVLSKHNMCRAVSLLRGGGRKTMIILGENHNIQVVAFLIDQLIPRIESIVSQAWKVYTGDEKRNTFRRGFLKGCVSGINYKLTLQKHQMEAESNTMMAMIKVNDTDLQEYREQVFKNTTPVKNRAGKLRKSSDSKYLGFKAGEDMQINKGLGNSESPGAIE